MSFKKFSDCVEDLYEHLPYAVVDCDAEAMDQLRRDIACVNGAWERFRAVRGAGDAPLFAEVVP